MEQGTTWQEGARRLELLAPLFYSPARELIPFRPETEARIEGGEEMLFRFALDGVQGRSIEPDPAAFLGPLGAAGSALSPRRGGGLELPRGRYLFGQERRLLDREEMVFLALEMQKDGLWEGLCLEDRLYLRYLREGGGVVSQLFRPLSPLSGC
jgi:hypothetical protein